MGELIEDAVVKAGGVQVADFVLADAADRDGRVQQERALPSRLAGGSGSFEAPDPAAAEVGEEEEPLEGGEFVAAVDGAAGDGAALRVVILGDGQRQGVGAAGHDKVVEAEIGLHSEPAVVLSSRAGGGLEIDLFTAAVSGIGNEEITGLRVKGEVTWVTEPQGPDFPAVSGDPCEGIGIGNAIRLFARFDIDAQQFAEQCVMVQRRVIGIAEKPAVPAGDIEITVFRTEFHVAAIVVFCGLLDGEYDFLTVGVGPVEVL